MDRIQATGIAAKIATVIGATLALFLRDLSILFADSMQNETSSYIVIVPFILVYLIYRKRKMLRAMLPLENKGNSKVRRLPTIAGILAVITAVLMYWYGSYTFTPLEYHMAALPLFTVGLVLLLFNTQTLRQLAFPIAFLLFLMPPPSEILYGIGSTLSIVSSQVSSAVIGLMGIAFTLTNEYANPLITITRPDGTLLNFSVDIACSGIYSIVGFFVFAMIMAYVVQDKPWKKIALILIGLPLLYLFNVIRITLLLLIGYYSGESLLLQATHLFGGWVLVFLATLLLLVISEKVLKTQILVSRIGQCSNCSLAKQSNASFCLTCGRVFKFGHLRIRKMDVVKMFGVAISVLLLISIQAPAFALTQSPAVVMTESPTGQEVSKSILPEIPGYVMDFSYRDSEFEALAKIDMAVAYIYTSVEEPGSVWATIEIASSIYSLHRWETCLINYPLQRGNKAEVAQIELSDIQLVENPHIVGRYFAFQYPKSNLTQVVLYWYEQSTFIVNSTSQQKYVKISLIAYPETLSDLSQMKGELTDLARLIVDYWQPIKTWSSVAKILSQNGGNFTALSGSLLIAVVVLYGLENGRRRKANRNAYQKLSNSNKQIINAAQEAERKNSSTLSNIADAYQDASNQIINKDQLLKSISELEKTGIIERDIFNYRDAPICVWRAQMSRDSPYKVNLATLLQKIRSASTGKSARDQQ